MGVLKIPKWIVEAIAAGMFVEAAVASAAFAERPGASATATAHALDELHNAVAQGKVTLTPTPTGTSTPTPTFTPAPAQQAAAPADPPMLTPEPSLPVLMRGDDPVSGYLRPSLMADGETLELALPQGRWDVRFAKTGCLQAWSNVKLFPNAIVLGSDWPWPACDLAGASWRSDASCEVDDAGLCDVWADLSYWDWLSHQPADTPVPTSTPTLAPSRASHVPAPTESSAAVAPAPAAAMVVQTVVVTATPELTGSPEPTATAVTSPTVTATPTPKPTATATATPMFSGLGLFAVPTAAPTPTPALRRIVQQPEGVWDWGSFLRFALVVLVLATAAIWFLSRRKVVQWRARPASPREGFATHESTIHRPERIG